MVCLRLILQELKYIRQYMIDKKNKIIISAVTGSLLLLLYVLIFMFSAQNAEETGALSRRFSEKCVEIINHLSGHRWSDALAKSFAEYFEHPVRKLAHFSEYAIMGILVYVLWAQWMAQGKKLYLLTIAWVFFSAMADEFHQLFVPGRYGSFVDVLLDTAGGAFGVLVCTWVTKIFWQSRRRKYATEYK